MRIVLTHTFAGFEESDELEETEEPQNHEKSYEQYEIKTLFRIPIVAFENIHTIFGSAWESTEISTGE